MRLTKSDAGALLAIAAIALYYAAMFILPIAACVLIFKWLLT